NQIFRLDVWRDVTDALTATSVDVASDGTRAMGPVLAGRSITSGGAISATANPGVGESVTIKDVQTGTRTSGSDMAGTISTEPGTILSVVANDAMSGSVSGAVLGDSGSPGSTDAIQVSLDSAGDSFSGSLSITGNVYGNVNVSWFDTGATLTVGGDLD